MSDLAALETELRAAVAAAAGSVPPELTFGSFRRFADSGERYGYERPYFERRGRLVAAGGAALFDLRRTGAVGPDLLNVLADELWRVCDEYTWALPAHEYHVRDGEGMRRCVDLFAAETAHTLAEILAACGERLDQRVAGRVRAEILDRVLLPYTDDPRPYPWESFTNNWLAVCAGAVGMAALALLPSDPDRLARALSRSRTALDRFVGAFGADGGCSEGVDYWVYGFGYFVYFAEALRDHDGSDLLADAKVREIAAFPARVGFGDGRYPNFSDGSETAVIPTGLMSRLADRIGAPVPRLAAVPSHASDFCHRWPHLARNIGWTDPAVLGRTVAAGASYLPDLGWIVNRGGDVEFAAKAGHNDELHNHLDVGHFILRGHGETLLADLGGGEYTKDYFGPDRYADIHPASEGHSVPAIDGRGQRPGREYAGRVLRATVDDHHTELRIDLAPAYGLPTETLVRTLDFRGDRLRVVDRLAGDLPLAVDELFISHLPPRISGDRVTWTGERAVATLTATGPVLEPVAETVETSDHRGRPETVHRLRMRGTWQPGDPSPEFLITVTRKEN